MSEPAPLTLGTAGHIDHGKTALVRLLTGAETDRLPEERRRGISIALGYAELTLPGGRRVSVVDVPGHERFVRTMVAGATGIDLFLMAIAADDGVMPQTREHAAVLAGLGVGCGVVAVTKSDAADPRAALAQARALLPEAEAVAVSAHTGEGLPLLRSALERAASALFGRSAVDGPARLHVDRVFSIVGAGTVVTGTLWSGVLAQGQDLIILPSARRARVRGVQVHDRVVERALAGQRVAVNLAGVRRDEVRRGDLLAAPEGELTPRHILDVALELPEDGPAPRLGERLQVHHGTRESPGRAIWLGGRFWQLRLERALLAERGDRMILRRIAPPDTLGGGVVLDAHARRHGPDPDTSAHLQRRLRGEPDPVPMVMPPSDTSPAPPVEISAGALALEARLREAWYAPPSLAELSPTEIEQLAFLRSAGRVVRVGPALHYHPEALADVERRVVELIEDEGTLTLARLRDALAVSRRFAQALLEHLDGMRVTRRLPGDERVLRRR